MKCRFKFRNIVASICLAALSGMAYADDTAVNLALPTAASFYTRNLNFQSCLLAANEAEAVRGQAGVTPVTPAAEFQPPLMSGRKAHEYLGLGTLALFGLTALTAPGGERNNTNPPTTGTHQSLGRATAAMAAATVMTGLIYHWDDIHWEDPFTDPDKMHARLGAAGALLMLYAVSVAPAHVHSSAGIAGGAAMVVAVKLTW